MPPSPCPTRRPPTSSTSPSHFGAKWLIVGKTDHGQWPAVLDGADPDAACFQEVLLPIPDDPADAAAIRDVRVFRIACSGVAGASAPESAVGPSE